jgi:nitrogen fixation protein FixH
MTGWRIGWYFVAFFSVIAAVNAAMVAVAIHTHSGAVTEHPYEKGLAYNQVIEAKEKQEALGWRGVIDYKNGVLYFMLRDKRNRLIAPEETTAIFVRPTQQGIDFALKLQGAETSVDFPAKGVWQVQVDVIHEGVHYQQSKRIVVI